MGRDKYHPYQTVGDVIWLALTDRKDSPKVDQSKKPKRPEDEDGDEVEKRKR